MKKFSEKRILQITNDISEEMCCATKEELIAVVKYWQQHYEEKAEVVRVIEAQDNWGKLLKKLEKFSTDMEKEIENNSQKIEKKG